MAEYAETLFPEMVDCKKRAFLAAFAQHGRVTVAARSANVVWRNHYNWLRTDPAYVEAFQTAKLMAADFWEQEAIRRATEGTEKKVFWQGEHIDNQTEHSDLLLIFLLKGAMPDKYRENIRVQGEVTVKLEESLEDGMKRVEQLRHVRRLPSAS